jgi:hypothetical protein
MSRLRVTRDRRAPNNGSAAQSPRNAARFDHRLRDSRWHGGGVLTIFGVLALTFMMAMYALESRGRNFVLAFALGCGLSSAYGFLSGAWPFGAVEAVWTLVAVRRWWALASPATQ